MSGESIALAKHIDLDKMEFPAYLSIKYDGVPVKLTVEMFHGTPHFKVVTRSHETAHSVYKDMADFVEANDHLFLHNKLYTFVFETMHETFTGFKDISGVVRRQTPQDGLMYNLFDFAVQNVDGPSEHTFQERLQISARFHYLDKFRVVQQLLYTDKESLQDALDNTKIADDQEGWIVRAANAMWKPGSRHWDYQKVVKEPTLDLWIIGMEEGRGKFAGGVGKLIASYKGKEIGVGPGKQTTAERNELWQEWVLWQAAIRSGYKDTPWKRMAKIKHKPDEGYEALRQPTFQCWRDDKTEADA